MEIHILQVPLHILGRRGGKTGGQALGAKQSAAAKNMCGTKKYADAAERPHTLA